MKVCIVTIFDNTNYGTYLQAYALNEQLRNLGCDSFVLNYERSKTSALNMFKTRFSEATGVGKKIWSFPEQLFILPLQKHSLKKEIALKTSISKKVRNIKEISSLITEADIYCTGSDQVWNSDYNNGIDGVYYLAFVPDTKRKIAYAASIGQSCFNSEHIDEIKRLLQRYSKISLRESESVELVKNLTSKTIDVVLDPTFLFDKQTWQGMFALKTGSEPYLLIYSVESNKTDLLIRLGKKIASERKLKIYVIEQTNPFRQSLSEVDYFTYLPSIEQFLTLFFNASYIIASSFHGTAFSINFGKQFIIIQPDKYNIRIESLLKDFGLLNRMINVTHNNEGEIASGLEQIDYTKIHKNLYDKRLESIKILNDMIFG